MTLGINIPFQIAIKLIDEHLAEVDEIHSKIDMNWLSNEESNEALQNWYSQTSLSLKKIFREHSPFLKFKRCAGSIEDVAINFHENENISNKEELLGILIKSEDLLIDLKKTLLSDQNIICPIRYDSRTHAVILNGETVGTISLDTQPCNFLLHLISIYPKKISCEKIISIVPRVLCTDKNAESAALKCSQWQKEIIKKCPELDEYIYRNKGFIQIKLP